LSLGIPLQYIPFISCYAWLLIALVLQLYIWKRLELNAYSKFFLSITTVLVPLQAEVLMNLTNVQWIMALFPIIIFSSEDAEKNKKWFYADILILFIVGFTGPNMILLLPVLMFYMIQNRKEHFYNLRWKVLAFMVIFSSVITTVTIINHGSVSRSEGTFTFLNPDFINYIYVQYALLFIGKFAFDTPFILKSIFVALLFIYIGIITLKILRKKITNKFTIFTFFSGILFLVTTLISYRHNPGILHPHYGGVRNFYLPAVFCIWYSISVLKPVNNPVPALSLLMFLFIMENLRCIGRERMIDYTWKTYAPKISNCDTLSIPINPEGWHLFIDNRKLNKLKH
jgi:hypothetical protein